MMFYRRSIFLNCCLYLVWTSYSFMGQAPKHTTEPPYCCHWDTDEGVTTRRLLAGSFEQVWMDDESIVVNFNIERLFRDVL